MATQETHKHEEEGVFLRFELTALTLTLRIWQSAMKTESSQNLDKTGQLALCFHRVTAKQVNITTTTSLAPVHIIMFVCD